MTRLSRRWLGRRGLFGGHWSTIRAKCRSWQEGLQHLFVPATFFALCTTVGDQRMHADTDERSEHNGLPMDAAWMAAAISKTVESFSLSIPASETSGSGATWGWLTRAETLAEQE